MSGNGHHPDSLANHTPYYRAQFERGLQYQDFVYELLHHHGITTVSYSSGLYQRRYGENKARIEIKYNSKFREHGELWIEYAEKSNPQNPHFVDSGISLDSWWFVIGDYETVYFFSTNILRLALDKYLKEKKVQRIKTKTSHAYLLPVALADLIADRVFRPNCDARMQALREADRINAPEARRLQAEMLRAIERDARQGDLPFAEE